MRTRTIPQRIDAGGRRRLLAGASLLAPAALMPERIACAILDSIASISIEAIAGIAAVSNALTLTP